MGSKAVHCHFALNAEKANYVLPTHRGRMPIYVPRRLIGVFAGLVCAGLMLAGWSGAILSSPQNPPHIPPPRVAAGGHVHDFDFLVGRWQVHHRQLNKRLTNGSDWIEFGGTLVSQPMLGGQGNVDDNLINKPSDPYHAIAIRAFDKKAGRWSIWWLDGRAPSGPLEPAVHGGFKDGVGLFYAEDTLNGHPILVRYTWSEITPQSCKWEQAFSPDNGQTWETNWTMNLTRVH